MMSPSIMNIPIPCKTAYISSLKYLQRIFILPIFQHCRKKYTYTEASSGSPTSCLIISRISSFGPLKFKQVSIEFRVVSITLHKLELSRLNLIFWTLEIYVGSRSYVL